MIKPLEIIGFLLGCLGTLLTIISASSTYWLTIEGTDHGVDYSYHIGLFKYCFQGSGPEICSTDLIMFTNNQADYNATKALEIMSIIVALGTGCIYIFFTFILKKDAYIPVIVLAFISGIFGIIAVNVFSSNLHIFGFDLGWSFYIGWVGAVAILIGNVFFIVNRRIQRSGMQQL